MTGQASLSLRVDVSDRGASPRQTRRAELLESSFRPPGLGQSGSSTSLAGSGVPRARLQGHM